MIDTHAHVRSEEDIKIEGLSAVILSASNLEDSKENLGLSKKNKVFYPAVGIHPLELGEQKIDDLINELDEMVNSNENVVAIGECGLDFSAPHDAKKQEIFFRGQISVALKHDKPIIVHSRKAADETLKILSIYKDLRGVIHCYSGGKKRIKQFLDLPGTFCFGVDGNLTYEEGLVEVVKNIPKDRLILETDSPELTPIPHRGEKNYPEYVKFIYEKVANIWQMSFEETEKIIDGNARKLFGIKSP